MILIDKEEGKVSMLGSFDTVAVEIAAANSALLIHTAEKDEATYQLALEYLLAMIASECEDIEEKFGFDPNVNITGNNDNDPSAYVEKKGAPIWMK